MPVTIFTTRADTVFGVTFMVLAPESELVEKLTAPECREEVEKYVAYVKKKTERERLSETRSVTGVFSGSYGINPLTGKEVPIWISEYVLAGYGTGAIMAVPAHDSRDYAFAKKFGLPIIPLIEGCDVSEESFDAKDGIMCNSGFLDGMPVKEAIEAAKDYVEAHGLGHRKTNFRLRDAIFSRQRSWGEPFPIYYKDGIPMPLPESELPLRLPEISSFKPSPDGQPPLARAKDWTYKGYPLEKSTMPGFAGSSAYYLRYMDPHDDKALVSREADEYWRNVDLYVGGTEHATGHLIYSRFWNKFLYDLGYVCEDEPFRKLVNQGMIQGRSNFVYRIVGTNRFVSCGLKDQYDTTEIHVDINIVHGDRLDQSKPWDTKGIDGVNRFLKKFWRLFYDRDKWLVTDDKASAAELKVLHKLIAKEQEDIESFSYNTTVSAFMIAVNDLGAMKCSKREILESMVVLLCPFAPHICEELWHSLGHSGSVAEASFPEYVAAYAAEDNVTYPVQFNGKVRFTVDMPKSASPAEVESKVRSMEQTAKWASGMNIVKVIVVPGRIINIVLK